MKLTQQQIDAYGLKETIEQFLRGGQLASIRCG